MELEVMLKRLRRLSTDTSLSDGDREAARIAANEIEDIRSGYDLLRRRVRSAVDMLNEATGGSP